MIPKIIHYCWFGENSLPEDARKCIASWKKYLPDYEIKEWNEDNFDVNMIPYISEAYRVKKYAFVSDYARFWILYKYGGLYFDTDVEVIKPINDIIERGSFMGYECSTEKETMPLNIAPGLGLGVNPGLGLGVNPGLSIIKEILEVYEKTHFIVNGKIKDDVTIVNFTTDVLKCHGINRFAKGIDIVENIHIYAPEFFCPLDYHTGILSLTDNSCTIHHYTASWKTASQQRKEHMVNILGPRITKIIVSIKHFVFVIKSK